MDDAGESSNETAELLALQRIDETCVQLQQSGNYLEALECMERGLVLRQHFFGSDSNEVWSACRTVGEMCNLLAMTYLQQQDYAMVLELLKKAEILTERDDKGRAVTFNNFACYYRRQGKLHAALQFLQKALRIESRLVDVPNAADTYLNTCAVLSQLGRHQSALEHAQNALILLQEELFHGIEGGAGMGGEEAGLAPPNPPKDRIAVLAIAYHNIGVEQEFLKKFEMSLTSYRKGIQVAERFLGGDHAIALTLRNSLTAARRAFASKDPKGRKLREEKRSQARRAAAAAKRTAPGTTSTAASRRTGGGQAPAEDKFSAYRTMPPALKKSAKSTKKKRAPRPQADPAALLLAQTKDADVGASIMEDLVSPRPDGPEED